MGNALVGLAVLATVIMFVALIWAIVVDQREVRAAARRLDSDEKLARDVEVMHTADAFEASENAVEQTQEIKVRRTLRHVTDELGTWAPDAHQAVDAFLFEQTAYDFGALRRFAASREFAGAAA